MVLTIQWDTLSDYENGQDQLQRLHSLRDRVFVVSPRLRATLEIVGTLEALEAVDICTDADSRSERVHHRRQFLYELKTYKALTKGLLESTKSLESRMESILTMLSVALSLRQQATGVDISGGVLKMTTEIVSDSTTVRVITFVTLLYMPATFIATVLGTNLFSYSGSGPHAGFRVSPQFWIFVVLAIPLTLVTIGCWFFYSQRAKKPSVKKSQYDEFNNRLKSSKTGLETLAKQGVRMVKQLVQGTEKENFVGP
ncbi:MAG: hypothetical protein Q9196_004834 [Gyalolechia fulgens]